MSADVLPQLKLEQSWKPGRFMHDITHEVALVLQLPIERCAAPLPRLESRTLRAIQRFCSIIGLSSG